MPNAFLYIETVLFQVIQFSISIDFFYIQLNVKIGLVQVNNFSKSTQFQCQKAVLFQIIQFSISTQFSFLTHR